MGTVFPFDRARTGRVEENMGGRGREGALKEDIEVKKRLR